MQTEYLHIDRDEPEAHFAHLLIVKYRAKPERGPGLSGCLYVYDIAIDSILETRAWYGEIEGGRVSLSNDGKFEDFVLADVRRELSRTAGNDCGLWHRVRDACVKDYEELLTCAD